jgi:hypothetical protein
MTPAAQQPETVAGRPWIVVGAGNWLRFDPLTTAEVDAIVDRLDRDYGHADMAGCYALAWLDVARLLSTLAALPDLEAPPLPVREPEGGGLDVERLAEAIRLVWTRGHSDLRSGLTTDPTESTLATVIAAEYRRPE